MVMDKHRKRLWTFVGLLSLVCLLYPIGTALTPVVLIVDGIVGVAYGKKLNERRYLAFFTYVLLLGVLSLPLFLLFCCYGLKQMTSLKNSTSYIQRLKTILILK